MKKSDQNKNKLGFWSIVLLGINGVMGSGIFLLPNNAYKSMGTASLLAFVFASVLVLLIALVIGENASLFKEDGGPYLYTKEAFGNFVSYEVGILNWLAQIFVLATVVNGFITTLAGISPAFADGWVKTVSIMVTFLILIVLNVRGLKLTKYVNNLMTFSKLIPLFLFLCIGIFFLKGQNFQPLALPQSFEPANFAQTVFLIFYAFGGFEALPLVAGEMENPRKNLPRALIVTISLISVIYIALQVVSIGILGPDLATSVVPVQDAFQRILGPVGGILVAAGTIIASAGASVATAFWTPRPAIALSKNKMLPAFLSKENKRQMPYIGIIVTLVISMLISISGSFVYLSQVSSVITFLLFIPTTLALVVFRYTKKEERTFKVKGGKTIAILAALISIVLLTQASLDQFIGVFIVLILAIPFYFIYARKNNTQKG